MICWVCPRFLFQSTFIPHFLVCLSVCLIGVCLLFCFVRLSTQLIRKVTINYLSLSLKHTHTHALSLSPSPSLSTSPSFSLSFTYSLSLSLSLSFYLSPSLFHSELSVRYKKLNSHLEKSFWVQHFRQCLSTAGHFLSFWHFFLSNRFTR